MSFNLLRAVIEKVDSDDDAKFDVSTELESFLRASNDKRALAIRGLVETRRGFDEDDASSKVSEDEVDALEMSMYFEIFSMMGALLKDEQANQFENDKLKDEIYDYLILRVFPFLRRCYDCGEQIIEQLGDIMNTLLATEGEGSSSLRNFNLLFQRVKDDVGIDLCIDDSSIDNDNIRGIENPDSLCYMISIIQSLYALPQFYEPFLMVHFAREQDEHDKKDMNQPQIDSLIVVQELQRTFQFLRWSIRPFITIELFATAYFDYEYSLYSQRNSITSITSITSMDDDNINETKNKNKRKEQLIEKLCQQADASAFLDALLGAIRIACDVIDSTLVLGQTILGSLTGVCHHLIERSGNMEEAKLNTITKEEQFHSIALDLRCDDTNNTVISTLQSFMGEKEVQFEWQKDDSGYTSSLAKVAKLSTRTVKKVILPSKSMPHYLILRPKRFGFNAEILEKFKINNISKTVSINKERIRLPGARFIFPETIDLANLADLTDSVDGAQSQSDLYLGYNLKSIVIHQGSATDGHYFCFSRKTRQRIYISSSLSQETVFSQATSIRSGKNNNTEEEVSTLINNDRDWQRYDDELVSPCSLSDVFREGGMLPLETMQAMPDGDDKVESESEGSEEWGWDKNAFLLTYERENASASSYENEIDQKDCAQSLVKSECREAPYYVRQDDVIYATRLLVEDLS